MRQNEYKNLILKIKHSRDKRTLSLQNQGLNLLILAIYFYVFELKICQETANAKT